MIPKPPFPRDLTPEREISEFQRLKPRLAEVWDALTMREEEPHTAVVVPSLTLDQSELRKISGASFYEERLLFLLIRLRNPRARMVFVTSQPVHPIILEYYLQFLAGIPASHARSRLTLLCADDASPRSLTEKVLERPRLIERIRAGIIDPQKAYLTVFNSTPHERKLAVLLGVPLNACDPRLAPLGTKSGSRKVFREAGVDLPEGFEDLRTPHDVEGALEELRGRRPGIRRAVIKLDESFSGEGNALFRYPESGERAALREALRQVEFSVPWETPEAYFDKLSKMGGIAEEFIEAEEKLSPSAQLRNSPRGDVVAISTHDQILGGPSGQVFLGCRFPARDDYRMRIQEAGLQIGRVLAARSREPLRVDPCPDSARRVNLNGSEISLHRQDHRPTRLQFRPASLGPRPASSSPRRAYRTTRHETSSRSIWGLLQDLVDILTVNKLLQPARIGVLFPMGRCRIRSSAAIANNPAKVDASAPPVLDRETIQALARHRRLPCG
jgi:hypothetical protein